jgi:hypothetical protein
MPNEGRGDGAVKIIDAGLCRFETQAHDKEKEKMKSRMLPDPSGNVALQYHL